jgi:hypothetical protein
VNLKTSTISHTVIATYADAASARRGLVLLRNAGVADSAISIVGESMATPAGAADLVHDDCSVIMRIFWAGLIWGGVGAVVGAGIGYVLARLSFPTDNMAIQIASWAMFVHIAATLWAAYAVIYDGTPRGAPHRPSTGGDNAMVIVRSADASLLARAEAALHTSAAIAVRRS